MSSESERISNADPAGTHSTAARTPSASARLFDVDDRWPQSSHTDVWTEIRGRLADKRLELQTQWVRGHAGDPGNERCDQIARWFASGIAQLGHARRTRTAQPSGRGVNSPAPGTHYLSLVDGIVARHATWADCERRVHGVRGARFKKIRSPDEERATIAAWGLRPDALEYL